MSHIIRLREPWQRQPLAGGQVRFTRRFHQPTGLDANSRVWLVIENVPGRAVVSLNSQALGEIESQPEPVRFNITADLRPENLVEITVSSVDEKPDQFPGHVRLQIE